MISRKKCKIRRVSLTLLIRANPWSLFTLGLAVIPNASADACTVTVTLLGGRQLTFPVEVPAGTPVSSLALPIKGVVVSETMSCALVS